jgi:hypothetical protein
MKRAGLRFSVLIFSAFAVLGVTLVAPYTMASQNPKHQPQISDIHYFVSYVTDVAHPNANDRFRVIVTVTHPLIHSMYTIKGTSVCAKKVSGVSITKDLPPLTAGTDFVADGTKKTVVAIFRFLRSDLPAEFKEGNDGTGTYTFTISDPNAVVPDSVATAAPTSPVQIFP